MQEHITPLLKIQDHGAIAQLYDVYGAALYGCVLRIVSSKELAEQVIQDTFLKAWRYGPNYDEKKGRLFTWLLNIARNTAIDATRSAHFRNSGKTENTNGLLHTPAIESFSTDTLGLREVVQNLDEKYKVLIDLIYFKAYTQKEAAEIVGVPLSTVKTRLRFAILELRNIFGHSAN